MAERRSGGRVLFLYGLTSCGKSTAAERMREMCGEVLFVSSNDIFHDMISGKFFAMDFWREVARTIGAQYFAVRAMAEAGFTVVVDGMLLDLPQYRELFGMSNLDMVRTLFAPFDPLLVRFECPPEELRRRNLARGDRGEFQSDEQARLMTKDPPADLVIDALTTMPEEAAALILSAAGLPHRPLDRDEDRPALLNSMLYPLPVRVRPAIPENGFTPYPPRTSTEVRTESREDTDRAAEELLRRGYIRSRRSPDGSAVLIRYRGEDVTETCRISHTDGFDDLTDRIGNLVEVEVDRPAHSPHPEHPDMLYPVPYGFLPGTRSADGEAIDAYLVGFGAGDRLRIGDKVFGTVAAVVYRADDAEEKLIVTPPNVFLPPEALLDAVDFTERYFLSTLILPERRREKSCGCVLYRLKEGQPEILLIRESASGAWGFPKGHMKDGESPADTVNREVREETGLDLPPDFPMRDGSAVWQRSEFYSVGNSADKDVLYFLTRVPAGWEPRFTDGEADRSAWITPSVDPSAFCLHPAREEILHDAFQTIINAIG